MMANYLYKNIRWQFNKNPFANLLGPAVTETQFVEQLEILSRRAYLHSRAVDCLQTEFCMNKICLSKPTTEAEKAAIARYGEFWAHFVRLQRVFSKKYLVFPADDNGTRIEQIAELLCKCTQFAVDDNVISRLLEKARAIAALTEREARYLQDVVRLYKVKYYCASTTALLEKKPFAEKYSACFLQPHLLKIDFCDNVKYTQAIYAAKNTAAALDSFGMSATRLGQQLTHSDIKLFLYANGRNVFDTFVKSKFGQRHAEFESRTYTVKFEMSYFLQSNMEVRKCALTNFGKRARKFTVKIPLGNSSGEKVEYFKMGNALCIAAKECFFAAAVVMDNNPIECNGERELLFDVAVSSNETLRFDVVTLFAADSSTIADKLNELERFGATNCPYLWDAPCTRLKTQDISVAPTPHGYTALKPQKELSKRINFSYQLGSNDVATFADNDGNSTTLLDGFVFGVRGESVFSVQNGLAYKLNEGAFKLDADKLVYDNGHSEFAVRHEQGKIYLVRHDKPMRTLFYFPLERTSTILFEKKFNAFHVKDGERNYTLTCEGEVESYTSNALECNEEKLRYKLSDDLAAGTCLAICFKRASEISVTLTSAYQTPASTPIVKESLISTYLNYVNDKSVFCLNNHLKRSDSLTLAAICYTNPQFVKNYLLNAAERSTTFYYDIQGKRQDFRDELTLPLATVYYLNLIGDLPENLIKTAYGVLFFEKYEGKNLCVQALALLKAAKLNCFDKVKCLLRYNNLKKIICEDVKLYGYAQAIGAVPMTNPSKERLKDLCNKYEIPKSWYYVSQLENLYGLSISAGKLQILPKVTTNVLEQFALFIAGKRIDTTFAKASVQCMTLNGQQCFSSFYAPSLKNERNELIVSY